jgi:radical SAM superfamily enzyme YgiQ (UPF0313 family)
LIYLNPIDWASTAAPPYGLEILASSIAKLPVNVIIDNPFIYEDPVQYTISLLQKYTPDLIGLSFRNMDNMAHVWNCDDKHSEEIASRCFVDEVEPIIYAIAKNTPAEIICGGAGFSIAPKAFLKKFNLQYGIKGPGEETFTALVKCLVEERDLKTFVLSNFRELSGIVYISDNGEVENEIFGSIKENKNEIKRIKEYSAEWTGTTPVRVSHGCIGKCSYCVERNQTSNVHWRELDNIIEEIKIIGKEGQRIWLACSELNSPDESYAMKLCNSIIDNKINNTFSSYFLPINFSDELYMKLIEAGFIDNSICFGLTHVTDSILKENNIPFRRKNIEETMNILCSHGAKGITIGFILGLPGESKETLDELAEWVVQTSKRFGKGFRCFVNSGVRIYPNTPMQEYANQSYCDRLYGQRSDYDLLKPLVFSDYLPPKHILEKFLIQTRAAEGLVSAYNMGNDLLKDQPEVFIYLQKAHIFKSLHKYESAMTCLNTALKHATLQGSRRQINVEIIKLRVLSKEI